MYLFPNEDSSNKKFLRCKFLCLPLIYEFSQPVEEPINSARHQQMIEVIQVSVC